MPPALHQRPLPRPLTLTHRLLDTRAREDRERIRGWNTPPKGATDEQSPPSFWWAQFGEWCGADEQTMRSVIDQIERRWGSMEGYLDSIGFDAADRSRLVEALTCEA